MRRRRGARSIRAGAEYGYGFRQPRLLETRGRVSFLGRSPPRRSACECGEFVWQYAINNSWLTGLKPGARAGFLESCTEDNGVTYFPALCAQCGRRALG